MRLIVMQGPNTGHEYLLPGDESTIGRSASNSIVLPSAEISRKHARVWQEEESTYLEDLGSTNGTFVNNTRLTGRVALCDGDEIQIGDAFRLLVASHEDLTRPTSGRSTAAAQSLQPVNAQPTFSEVMPSSEIPTPRPPLYINPEERESDLEQSEIVQPPDYLRWIGIAGLVLITLLLVVIFLDSYQGGRLLYCGTLNPFFQVLLGPFGFNPICP